MKKIFKIASVFCFLSLLVSCGDEDQVVYDVDNGQARVGFVERSGNLPVFEEGVYSYNVQVGVTNRVNYDRTINLQINQELTTALPSQYSIDQATLKIPAGQFVGNVKITGNYQALPALVKQRLVFDIASVQDQNAIDPQNSRFFLFIFRACEIVRDEFVGTYNAVETPGNYQYEVVATAGTAPNELVLNNVYDVDPDSKTTIFINNDVANPVVSYPTPVFNGTNASVAANMLVTSYSTYGPLFLVGSTGSTFDSCEKRITLQFRALVAAGSFGAATVVLTKVD
jgi:hypothetical protein